MIFILGFLWLILGTVIFLLSALSGVPGVGSGDNAYLKWLDGVIGLGTFRLVIIGGACVALWPIPLGLIIFFK